GAPGGLRPRPARSKHQGKEPLCMAIKMGGKILVGLDGSTRAAGVLASAIQLARGFDAEVVLVRAVTIPLETPSEAFDVSPDRLLQILETHARENVESRLEFVP